MTQTACPNLKCPGLLIYRGDWYECVYCHMHYPVAQIENMEPLPLATLEDTDDIEHPRVQPTPDAQRKSAGRRGDEREIQRNPDRPALAI